MSQENYCNYFKNTGKIHSIGHLSADTDYIQLNDVELSNFKTGYWKIEDFRVEQDFLVKKETVTPVAKVDETRIKFSEIDCVFISYDEPNADRHYAELLNIAPWAKRVHGVKGSDAAHKAAANLSETERFITVDADNKVDPRFFRTVLDFKLTPDLKDKQLSWCGRNYVNGLVYGNGGLKCWTKDYVLQMMTHESSVSRQAQVDFCWNKGYKQMPELYSVSYINSTPRQAWRAGFREGVKMTLHNGLKNNNLTDAKNQLDIRNYQRLLVWTSVGADVDNGLWAIYGARLGCHMAVCTDWDYVNVRDFDYLNNLFDSIDPNKVESEVERLGKEISLKINLPTALLSSEQSRFFKEVWNNPVRYDSMNVLPNWDRLEL